LDEQPAQKTIAIAVNAVPRARANLTRSASGIACNALMFMFIL
jgi:hypothetical protein